MSTETIALWYAVQQFYFREARMLDERRFHEWVDLFSDDCLYWAPVRSNRVGRDAKNEISRYGEAAHFEEDKQSLRGRVKRMDTGMAWAETPASRTRHLISNVEIETTAEAIMARSAFIVYRTHLETDEEFYAGARLDTLRRVGDTEFRIARREILLDQGTILGKNLGIFF